jgi:enoyl-CoA hydratase/carnithine racemase
VIARLAGPARAGGIGLVAACDLAVAADQVSFAFTEVRIGVVPAVISVPLVPRVQPAALYELFLTGETFDARRAAAIGLLTRAVPATSWTPRYAATSTCSAWAPQRRWRPPRSSYGARPPGPWSTTSPR